MTAEADTLTTAVETEKEAVLLPAGTVMEAGTDAVEVLLAKLTVTPPLGAGVLSVTVAVEEVPPTTLTGLTEIVLSAVPSIAPNESVTVELAGTATLSWIWPPYLAQDVCEQIPVTGIVASCLVVMVTPTPGV